MSEDILGRLNELCGAVRARVEATPDFKTLQALERTLAEVKAFVPAASEPAMASSAIEDATAAVASETAPASAAVSGETAAAATHAGEAATTETVTEAVANAEPEAEIEAEAQAGTVAAAAAESVPSEPEAMVSEVHEEAAVEAAEDAAPEAPAANDSVVVPEIPAEHVAAVEDLAALATDATAPSSTTIN